MACIQEEQFRRMYKACQMIPTVDLIANMSDAQIKKLSLGYRIYIAGNLKTLACLSYKAAWTTQRIILTNNSSPQPIPGHWPNAFIWKQMEKNGVRELRSYTNVTEIRHILQNYFKFLFVRHPLDRIHSGYYDKLLYEMFIDKHGTYSEYLLPKILRLVRPDLLNQSLESIHLPFVDVLRFIKAGGTDRHFNGNYVNWCSACLIKYDYIGKVETFDKDMNHIITHHFPAGRGKSTHHNIAGTSLGRNNTYRKKLANTENVTEDPIDHIEGNYATDLKAFGYKIERIDGDYYSSCDGGCCCIMISDHINNGQKLNYMTHVL